VKSPENVVRAARKLPSTDLLADDSEVAEAYLQGGE
jgi:hypothetical protein